MLTIADEGESANRGGFGLEFVDKLVLDIENNVKKRQTMHTWSDFVRSNHNLSPKHMTVLQNFISRSVFA